MKLKLSEGCLCAAVTALVLNFHSAAIAQTVDSKSLQNDAVEDEIIVIGVGRAYSSNASTAEMALQQAPITSVLAQIDNLPGVNVSEGDVYGFDDWSINYSLRGFQTSLGEQQIGLTIDGMPNGDSNYGGGAKANRYIDPQNLAAVEVFQGTAGIASRTNEALGGTLNFTTQDPLDEMRGRISGTIGDHDAQRIYGRIDTGLFLNDTTKAWLSISSQTASDWMEGSAQNRRDHFAAKLLGDYRGLRLTAYAMYDDVHEDNYQRLYSKTDFDNNPRSDQLTGVWTGVPYVDQLYRRGWSTLRENFFAYLKAEGEVARGLNLSAAAYRHDNSGRGDWAPPDLVDVFADAGAETEFAGGVTNFGDPILGIITFVDPSGVALSPNPGCVSSITFPYGGAGPEYDAACFPANAIAVQSYRHTHYQKNRTGVTADFDWVAEFGDVQNQLRGGIWYEDAKRGEIRDWHKITDTRVGFSFDSQPYYVQYDRSYPQTTFKWYAENTVTLGMLTATLGAKQFNNNVDRVDNFGVTPGVSISSNSGVLLSGGVVITPTNSVELFAGYAENYKALNDLILERPASALNNLDPETSRVIDAGVRYSAGSVTGAITYFNVDFDNRLIFLDASTAAGPNYTIGTEGSFFNAGGIKSQGVEFLASFPATDFLSLFASYTYNDSIYIGAGDAVVDAALGIMPGAQVAGIPRQMFAASAAVNLAAFYGGASAKYVGDRNVFADGSFVADSYVVADLYFGVRGEAVADGLAGVDLRITVNNVLDEEYLGSIAINSGAWIGGPRTVAATLTADF